jgi:hypothetical protein
MVSARALLKSESVLFSWAAGVRLKKTGGHGLW